MTKELLNDMKEMYGFDKLSGKDKPLVAGFDIGKFRADFPAIKTIRISNYETKRAERIVSLYNERAEEEVKLHIIVAQQSCADAHEALFITYTLSSKEPSYAFGEKGINIGDFCLLTKMKPSLRRIDFVRNNIAIKVYGGKNTEFDIRELAKKIDDFIKNEPTWKSLDDSNKKPQIKSFSMEKPDISSGEKSYLRHEVVDPEEGILEYRFKVTGGSINQDPKNTNIYYYRAGNQKGEYKITLHVINERNLTASKDAAIRVI